MTHMTSAKLQRLHVTVSQVAAYSPLLIAVLLMVPRLLNPQFGLYDDGRMLVTADKITHGTWYTGLDSIEGRFRPVYWLWFSLSYLVGGKNPFWFYLANTLALVFLTAGLIFLVGAVGGSRFQAGLAGFIFILSGPVPESFLTLKGDVIQLVWMLLSFAALPLAIHAKRPVGKILGITLTTLPLLLADLTKETALALLPISLAWYLLARFWSGYVTDPARRAARGVYLLANLISALLFFLFRTLATPRQISAGTYTGQYLIDLGQMTVSALRWAGWLVHDFFWITPLLILGMILLALRYRLAGTTLLIDSLIWMGAWVGVYLPWNFMAEYYMLPFAIGLAVFVSAGMAALIAIFRESRRVRGAILAGIGLSLVLLAGELMNDLTSIRIQLAIDSSNARMVAFLVNSAEPDSTVLVNIQSPNEYYYEMQTQLGQLDGRPDLHVSLFSPGMTLANTPGTIYFVSPYVQNQPLLTVRMGVVEKTQKSWDNILQEYLQGIHGWEVVAAQAASLPLTNVNYPRLFCPLIKTRSYCAAPEPLIDTRQFNYGWIIDQLRTP
jgi:hypothetical protein